MRDLVPASFEAAAASLAEANEAGEPVRLSGGGTKFDWGSAVREPQTEISSCGLNQVLEHNAGDLTAVLQAGVPLAIAQAQFAQAGQMFALDPPLGRSSSGSDQHATIGGVVATADSGPLRHRYGSVRDLVIGITVALADGTIARAGGKVIKNVAGYDLPKLFAGAFGTLGMILAVAVRLHPRPQATTTALGASTDPGVLAEAVRLLAASPLELDSLDLAWRAGRGGLLARVSGAEPDRRATRAARLMRAAGLEQLDVRADDDALWARQRAGQRAERGAVVRVSSRPTDLPAVLAAADQCGGTLVGRAALGSSYLELEPEAIVRLRDALPPDSHAVLLDAPDETRGSLDPWGVADGAALELMRQVKARFDPRGICNRGVFVGGI